VQSSVGADGWPRRISRGKRRSRRVAVENCDVGKCKTEIMVCNKLSRVLSNVSGWKGRLARSEGCAGGMSSRTATMTEHLGQQKNTASINVNSCLSWRNFVPPRAPSLEQPYPHQQMNQRANGRGNNFKASCRCSHRLTVSDCQPLLTSSSSKPEPTRRFFVITWAPSY
jgi:hypothetical protein